MKLSFICPTFSAQQTSAPLSRLLAMAFLPFFPSGVNERVAFFAAAHGLRFSSLLRGARPHGLPKSRTQGYYALILSFTRDRIDLGTSCFENILLLYFFTVLAHAVPCMAFVDSAGLRRLRLRARPPWLAAKQEERGRERRDAIRRLLRP